MRSDIDVSSLRRSAYWAHAGETHWPLILVTALAAATMTVVPVPIVFAVAQRQFVEGLAHAGLKG